MLMSLANLDAIAVRTLALIFALYVVLGFPHLGTEKDEWES